MTLETDELTNLDVDTVALARAASFAADAKDGEAIEVLDVSGVQVMCDVFVLVSGRTERQVKAIADEVEAVVRERTGRTPQSVEGRDSLRWVLLDYGDVIVHVFEDSLRDFYDLDSLWADAPRVPVAPPVRQPSVV